ncbi:fragile X mental retardation 1 neighbor protein [Ochotona curzoniae]|uniref:fragile X mental retardation 1 neighbor protein n=1 Tax=Ochotona curzoniae TaxID=130825 RepID=UPI001B347CD4|nr:fragile X mental retardation 1 neighbor protein [Ochotona curzoniae]
MPSEAKPLKERLRSKRASRGARSKLGASDADRDVQVPAQGAQRATSRTKTAALPQGAWQTPLRAAHPEAQQQQQQQQQPVAGLWARRRFRMLTLVLWAFLVLGYYLRTGGSNSGSYDETILQNNTDQTLGEQSMWDSLSRFFFPTTCTVKEKQVVKPCTRQKDLKESECLRYKCCFSSSRITNLRCYAPLRDKPTQVLRMFGVSVITMISLGILPILCCSLFQRSGWTNPLRKKNSGLLQVFKKPKIKIKSDIARMEEAMDEENGESDPETKALFHH